MRLLHTVTLQLLNFASKEIPDYAILSHTWEQDEVLLEDMLQPNHEIALANKAGYKKIKDSCQRARRDGYAWIWIDTCCIDKTSSAELSEAINSMYQWYARSCVCYAYLSDVSPLRHDDDDQAIKSSLYESRWFKRGWTLQELIAPKYVEFYANDWSEIGTKSSLRSCLAEITSINPKVLQGCSISSCSIAERMAWAEYRETTRVEDVAYCLLGIFDINMPLLYGEGRKAFKRLQYEILQQHEDLTLLAWPYHPPTFEDVYDLNIETEGLGVLARHPVFFSSGNTYFVDTEGTRLDWPPSFKGTNWVEMSYEPLLGHDDSSTSELTKNIKSISRVLGTRIFHPPSITSRGLRIYLFVNPSQIRATVQHCLLGYFASYEDTLSVFC